MAGSFNRAGHLFFTIYYLLYTIYYLLFIICNLLFTIYYLLLISYYLIINPVKYTVIIAAVATTTKLFSLYAKIKATIVPATAVRGLPVE